MARRLARVSDHSGMDQEEVSRTPEPRRGSLFEWTVTALLLLFGWASIGQAFVIPTGSMEETLLIGDHLWVDKLAYAPGGAAAGRLLPYTPIQRGDIIVFQPPFDIRQPYVKRVIGVPGDRLRLRNKQLYLNGKQVQEPYKYHKTDYLDPYRDNFPSPANAPLYKTAVDMLESHVVNGEVVVPPDSYFAMGDNRDLSLDSRYWGFVPRRNIIGKPVMVWWSYDAPTERLQNPLIGWEHAQDLVLHFFTKTRWGRTFQLIRGYRLERS